MLHHFFIFDTPYATLSELLMPFAKLGLSRPLVQAITELGYQTPTPIQEQAIPAILSGKDLIATAQTGTGKTAAFVLPLLEQFSKAAEPLRGKRIRALILVPTRELAVQVDASVAQYAKHTPAHLDGRVRRCGYRAAKRALDRRGGYSGRHSGQAAGFGAPARAALR